MSLSLVRLDAVPRRAAGPQRLESWRLGGPEDSRRNESSTRQLEKSSIRSEEADSETHSEHNPKAQLAFGLIGLIGFWGLEFRLRVSHETSQIW